MDESQTVIATYDPVESVASKVVREINAFNWVVDRIECPCVYLRDGNEKLKIDLGEFFDESKLPKIGEPMRIAVTSDVT